MLYNNNSLVKDEIKMDTKQTCMLKSMETHTQISNNTLNHSSNNSKPNIPSITICIVCLILNILKLEMEVSLQYLSNLLTMKKQLNLRIDIIIYLAEILMQCLRIMKTITQYLL